MSGEISEYERCAAVRREVVREEIAKGNPPGFSWWDEINRAERDRGFDDMDRHRAGTWTTCACGAQDPRIPRQGDGAPEDGVLIDLGMDFHRAVRDNKFNDARIALGMIEMRSSKLIYLMEWEEALEIDSRWADHAGG